MKYSRASATGQAAVNAVATVVSGHGSIMREVPGGSDVGIDAFIELVHGESATADLVAVQIKGGDSFVGSGESFRVSIDERHLEYWGRLLMPVLLICHSQSRGKLCWTPIHQHVEHARYHARPLSPVVIPFSSDFTVEALDGRIGLLARQNRHQFSILQYMDQTFDDDPAKRLEAFRLIVQHPVARYSATAVMIARRMLSDDNDDVVRNAIWFLGYCAGRMRFSWNPMNSDEGHVSAMAQEFCRDITPPLVRRMFDLVWSGILGGPDSLAERLSDIIPSNIDAAAEALIGIASDESESLERRQVALFVWYGCEDSNLDEAIEEGDSLAIRLFSKPDA